mgnify:CR=1 FL=1
MPKTLDSWLIPAKAAAPVVEKAPPAKKPTKQRSKKAPPAKKAARAGLLEAVEADVHAARAAKPAPSAEPPKPAARPAPKRTPPKPVAKKPVAKKVAPKKTKGAQVNVLSDKTKLASTKTDDSWIEHDPDSFLGLSDLSLIHI